MYDFTLQSPPAAAQRSGERHLEPSLQDALRRASQVFSQPEKQPQGLGPKTKGHHIIYL